MDLYKSSTMETYYAEDLARNEHPCEVKIAESGKIVVSYKSEVHPYRAIVYQGTQLSEGHWELHSVDPHGHASLHRMSQDSVFLEGCWQEQFEESTWVGMWRIRLK